MITIVEKVKGVSKEAYAESMELAARAIQRGGIVAFPTETVYGLGANALSERAVNKIYRAKGRPSDNPLIVHIAGPDQLDDLVRDVGPEARLLMDYFWPGPMTLIFKKKDIIPDVITGGLDTVAVRIPSNRIAVDLIRASELPLAAPSANLSGKPSPTNAFHVLEDLKTRVDFILDGGSTTYGLESTIVDVSSSYPALLRPGAVTLEMIKNIIGEVIIPDMNIKGARRPQAPGMKYTHYAPKARVTIVNGSIHNVAEKIKELINLDYRNIKTGIMATEQTKRLYHGYENVISVGDRLAPETIAANLYETLRKFDYYHVDHVFAEGYGEDGIGFAIMNRLKKASGYDIINV